MIDMLMNKKGQEEEGMRFNLKRLSVLIVFVVLIAIGIIILIPKLSAEAASKTTSGFGKYVYDILVGGKGLEKKFISPVRKELRSILQLP